MQNKKKLVIIDGNNLLHRAYYKFKNMAGNKRNSAMVFGFPYILNSLIGLHKPDDLLVVFDGGKSKHRKKVLPDYKKRDKREGFDLDEFISQRKAVEKILKALGIAFTYKIGEEADDIIWLYARKYKRTHHVIIVSNDKDFNQLLSKDVSIWNANKNKRITHKNVENLFGYSPEECVDFLILDGDSSDNISGYPGVGPKTARKFLDKYGSIKKYLYTYDFEEDKKIKRQQLEELFLINRKLIDIRYFCRKHLKFKDVPLVNKPGKKIKKKKLALICSDYGIKTFTEKRFIKNFENLLK